MTDETIKHEPSLFDVLEEIKKLNSRFDSFEKSTNAQFESIREGIVHNGVAFDRLQAVVYNLRADVRELSEEIRKDKLALK